MSEIVANLVPEIRGAKAPERGPGHKIPTPAAGQSPATVSQADAIQRPARGRQRDFAVAGASGPAMQGAANHYGWRVQDALEIKAYAETTAIRAVDAGATVVLDTSVATVWRLTCAGPVTLQVPLPPETTIGGQPASRTVSVLIFMYRQPGTAITWPAGTMFPREVLDLDGDGDRSDSLLAPPDAARLDAFVLAHVPGIGWIGTVSAIGLEPV